MQREPDSGSDSEGENTSVEQEFNETVNDSEEAVEEAGEDSDSSESND